MITPLHRQTWLWLGVPLLAIVVANASALLGSGKANPPADAKTDAAMEKQVRALFAEHCYRCHSHQAGKSKGDLVLDSMASMRKGGKTAPAVVPGEPAKSLLIKAVMQDDDDLKMPRDGKLAAVEIALLRDWIKSGAPWTETTGKPGLRLPGQITDADRKYWAFQPVMAVAPPEVKDAAWAKNPIDRFVRHRLDAEGLKPSTAADRRALVRRIYFDITGLPPMPAEVEAFVNDPAANAVEKLVDTLLASPRYGEQMARHWLDLVRYAESDGFRQDAYRQNAWRYRDYVVRAFNADKPYNRFVREQVAGDELDPDDADCVIASGYLAHGIYEFNQRDVRTQWDNMLAEVTDVTADVFLGLGFACARCHDHKYDPILQKDYFALQAFFAGLMPAEDVPLLRRAERAEYDRQQAVWLDKTAKIRAEIAKVEAEERGKSITSMVSKFPPDIQTMINKPTAERTAVEHQLATLAYRQVQGDLAGLAGRMKGDAKTRLLELHKELTRFDADRPPACGVAFAAHDVGTAAPPTLIPKRKGAPIEPAILSVLKKQPLQIAPPPGIDSTGRRLALANWLTQPEHPLVARVIVNRVWQQHFGRGLIATPNDFGNLGDKPSHPELLDWLADRFVKDGWSFKKLHRMILTSQTYRQSATAPASEAGLKLDPENRLLWRMTTRRLAAEQIRDAILSVTGQLDLKAGGPSEDAKGPRRSIYTKVLRNTRDPLLDVFDPAETFTSIAQRNVTTTPTQALLMLNSPFMQQQAQAFAARLLKESPADEDGRIDAAFRLVFGRAATVQQKEQVRTFLVEQEKRIPAAADARRAVLVELCLVLLNANEFVYVD
jgi:mono/diheme cytochrome c family protein